MALLQAWFLSGGLKTTQFFSRPEKIQSRLIQAFYGRIVQGIKMIMKCSALYLTSKTQGSRKFSRNTGKQAGRASVCRSCLEFLSKLRKPAN
ncbi:MAG: hypothetical protein K2X27_09345, partial [Candidatus Obscuribacterales bacterium]|nr:hypothetical protein [Candidatus Obscuribacterales bacterium]